jgi:hypothetical protein
LDKFRQERFLATAAKGSNFGPFCPPRATIGQIPLGKEWFFGFNSKYFVFEGGVRTHDFEDFTFHIAIACIKPRYGSIAEQKQRLAGFEPILPVLLDA